MERGSSEPVSVRVLGRLTDESLAHVNARLNWLKTRQKLSIRDLAATSGLAKSTVADILSGKNEELSLYVLVHLVRGFGLRSIDELVAPLGTMQLCRREFGNKVIP